MDTFEEKVRDIAQQVHDENSTSDQFAVSETPFHIHNGADSARISFANLVNRLEFINFTLPGTLPQLAGNYGVIFTAPIQCSVIAATEIHQTVEATATTMTVQLEKLTGTTASGSGTTLFINPFNLKSTANTLQTAMLNTTTAKTNSLAFSLNAGDRLGLVLTTTGAAPSTVVGVNIVITLQF